MCCKFVYLFFSLSGEVFSPHYPNNFLVGVMEPYFISISSAFRVIIVIVLDICRFLKYPDILKLFLNRF